jgi:hypothetical protein
MTKEILADRVIVYRNAIPNAEEWANQLLNLNYWEKWYDVGQQISLGGVNSLFNSFPTSDEFASVIGNWKKSHFFAKNPEAFKFVNLQKIEDIFFETTSDYIKTYPLNIPNFNRGGTNILRYDAKKTDEITREASGTATYALPFHTDFDQQSENNPGPKPAITVTMYLNDDYEGGDIEYRLYNKSYQDMRIEGIDLIDNETQEKAPGFNYKPQAGDVIIFPSNKPYYHGVKKVTQGQKVFIRTFWMYLQE